MLPDWTYIVEEREMPPYWDFHALRIEQTEQGSVSEMGLGGDHLQDYG